jgi:hypothetical protein
MSIKRHPKQLAWIKLYEERTGFVPLIKLDELEDGKIGFEEYAKANVKWYENHSQDAYLAISRDIPRAP